LFGVLLADLIFLGLVDVLHGPDINIAVEFGGSDDGEVRVPGYITARGVSFTLTAVLTRIGSIRCLVEGHGCVAGHQIVDVDDAVGGSGVDVALTGCGLRGELTADQGRVDLVPFESEG